jgi:hypothetical protein
MTAHRGTTVFLVTNAGEVPAITTAHYDSNGDLVDATAANAVTVDLVTVGYAGTRLTGVAKSGTSGTFANVDSQEVGDYYIPA